jgi:hypothetical protein
MKNIFYILLLLPTIIFAQYPNNSGHKITLGEQTTADGLIYRGVASIDTLTATNKITRANKQDTSAFILLDTVTNLLWHYKTASNGWSQAGGSTLDTATMLLPYWRSGRFSGTLPVANGGTNRTTMPAGYILHGDGTSVDTAIGLFWSRNVNRLGINNNNPAGALDVKGEIILNAGGVQFPAQFRNDFTPTSERADLFFFSNFISNNGFRWGTLASSGGVTFQGTRANDSGIKTNINFNPDGGNVGIGTVSPGNLLTIKDKSQIGFRDETSNSTRNALQNYAYTLGYGDGLRIGEQYNAVSIGGNVGIGTTNPQTKLQVANSSSAILLTESSSVATIIGTNAAGTASQGLSLRGFPLTFTGNGGVGSEAMRITSVGNVLIGTDADSGYKLNVNGTFRATGAATFSGLGTFTNATSNNQLTVNGTGAIKSGINFANGGTTYGQIYFDNNAPYNMSVLQQYTTGNLILGTNNTANLTIGNNGNVGIGVTSPYTKLQVDGGNISVLSSSTIGTDGTGDIRRVGFGFKHPNNNVLSALINTTSAGTWGLNLHFNVRGGNAVMPATPAITIVGADDSGNNGGNVGIRTTTPDAALTVKSIESAAKGISIWGRSDNIGTLRFYNSTGATEQGGLISTPTYLGFMYADAIRMTITSAGVVNIANLGTGTVYSSSGTLTNTNPSDERLKNNIIDISWGLSDILKLRPVSFNWKDDKISQGKQFGFIAQEVREVMPEAIKIFGEDVKYLGLEKDAIYATLVKAVQELSAEINILKQEIINLKNK